VSTFIGMSAAQEHCEEAIAGLYDKLARFAWWRRRLSRSRPGEGLAMRKALRPGSGELAGVEDLNSWLWERAAPSADPVVLDVGAGFGDTLLSWAAQNAGHYLGLGLSRYQVERATDQAKTLGLSESCRFLQCAFDRSPAGPFDLIVSIESLFHAADVRRTIARLAASLAPGGSIVMVEDMARDDAVVTSGVGRELCDRWMTPRLHTRSDYLEGLRDGGLEVEYDIDLSDLLTLSTQEHRVRRHRRLRRLRAILPVGRSVVGVFLGGLAMEEMHHRRDLCYRVLGARRSRS